jgi:hypothetical protein
MHRFHRRFNRSLTIGTAAAFGLSGLFIAPAAFAATPGADAPVAGSAYAQQAQELLADEAVQAVGRDAAGNVVVVVKTAADSGELKAFTGKYSNVVVHEIGGAIDSSATTDVVGGAGYFSPKTETSGAVCSVGFSGWSPTGAPAVITAGHCTDDGANKETYLTVPSLDAAGGSIDVTEKLGNFGFSQYGGVGNTIGEQNTDSTDIAVIDVTNDKLDLKPAVSDWSSVASEDLSKSTIAIKAIGSAVAGQPVSKSGRTTGYSTDASVDVVDGWAKVSGRLVYGFGTYGLESIEGDSGGAMFQGNTAVGVVSGGYQAEGNEPSFVWGTDLKNALAHTGGYTVAIAISAPVLTAPADGGEVLRGATISGTGPASTKVIVTPTDGAASEVTTDASGNFSFTAPGTLGKYSFSLQAKSGFNKSSTNTYAVNVVAAPLAAPVITSPADGSASNSDITSITGTAVPASKVTLTGDVTGTTTTNSAGAWSIKADLSYGMDYSVSAVQALDGQTSPIATSTFSVVPAAAAIITPANGAEFANDKAPTKITGTGINGAIISVTLNGTKLGTTQVENGAWSLALRGSVDGVNAIVVTQTIAGIATTTESSYTVAAAAVAAVPTPAAPAAPAPGADDPRLAYTGVDMLPAGGLAAALMLAGIAFLAIRKKRIGTIEN